MAKQITFGPLVKFMLVSTAINKTLMMYFGINYSQYPGRGYGWGLFLTVCYMLISASVMIYKYRNTEN